MQVVLYFQSASRTSSQEKLAGVQSVFARHEWLVQVIDGTPTAKRVAELAEFWHPVGIIVECGGGFGEISPSIFGRLPVVFLDRNPRTLPRKAFCISHESAATARMAARELMLLGRTCFAFVPFPEPRFWSKEREQGFVAALRLNRRTCRIFRARHAQADSPAYHRELRAFITSLPRPCALFAANDATAANVITAAHFAGVRIPEDLSVIGVDDYRDICEHTHPTLTSVKPDFRRGGELAALMLIAVVRSKGRFTGARHRTFGPLLTVHRLSTRNPTAVPDREVSAALELISAEACSGLTAAKVLGLFRCSRRLAEIRFQRATGQSILKAIHAVRLERAKYLLSDRNQQLKSIADFCGFSHPNSLRKFFLKETGMTMSAYRSRLGSIRESSQVPARGLQLADKD